LDSGLNRTSGLDAVLTGLGLCAAALRSAGLLAPPSETFLAAKGTPYLAAGLVILSRGAELWAGRFAGNTRPNKTDTTTFRLQISGSTLFRSHGTHTETAEV